MKGMTGREVLLRFTGVALDSTPGEPDALKSLWLVQYRRTCICGQHDVAMVLWMSRN